MSLMPLWKMMTLPLRYDNYTDFSMCYHHNTTEHTCTIYTERPEICRVDVYFEKHYQTQITWDDFVKINLIACKQLNDLDV